MKPGSPAPKTQHGSMTANPRIAGVLLLLAIAVGLGLCLGLGSMAQHRISASAPSSP